MGNVKVQGKARITIAPPAITCNAQGDYEPSRAEQLRRWAMAVSSVVFDGKTIQFVARVEIAWDPKHSAHVEIDFCVPYEWNAEKIRGVANELADKIYLECGTTLALQLANDTTRTDGMSRFYEPRVRVEWIQREVFDAT